VLAHSAVVGTDTGTAFFVSFALWTLRGMLRRPALASTLLCGLALGLAQLAKAYALLLYPTSVLVTLAWHRLSPPPRPDPRRLLGCLLGAMAVSLLVLNTGYLWSGFGASLSELPLQSERLASWRASPFGALPLPLPAAYLRALDGQLVEVTSEMPSYLFGETFEGGRWYYYPALLAIKTPIPLLVAFGLALALSVPRPRVPGRELALLATYPLLLLLVLSLGEGRQLGTRSLLSAAPLVQLGVAVTLARSGPKRWPARVAGAILVSLLAVSLRAHPDYLSYFNASIGGSRRGYLYASEANVDIGQDLVQLAEFLEAEGAESVQLLYFGSVDPALYGIEYEVPKGPPRPGLVAVSVSLYRMAYPVYDHGELRLVGPVTVGTAEPIASIGGSIHVYRVPEALPQ
jgi:4-amino-4-deoxy-L-arabinose transferase-like glycosyltransferase